MITHENIYAEFHQEYAEERLRRERAEAACAEMRSDCQSLLNHFSHLRGSKIQADCGCFICKTLNHALSTDCGKGWVSPEDYRDRMDAATKFHLQTIQELETLQPKLKLAVEALEKARHFQRFYPKSEQFKLLDKTLSQLKGRQ